MEHYIVSYIAFIIRGNEEKKFHGCVHNFKLSEKITPENINTIVTAIADAMKKSGYILSNNQSIIIQSITNYRNL